MKKNLYTKLFIFLISILPSLTYAGYNIAPVKVQLNKNKKIETMQFTNGNNKEGRFQLIVLKQQNKNGKSTYTEAKDVIVTPGMFKLAPSQTQTIRVAINSNTIYGKQEDGYKLVIKELPHRDTRVANANFVNLVTEFRVPISIDISNN